MHHLFENVVGIFCFQVHACLSLRSVYAVCLCGVYKCIFHMKEKTISLCTPSLPSLTHRTYSGALELFVAFACIFIFYFF